MRRKQKDRFATSSSAYLEVPGGKTIVEARTIACKRVSLPSGQLHLFWGDWTADDWLRLSNSTEVPEPFTGTQLRTMAAAGGIAPHALISTDQIKWNPTSNFGIHSLVASIFLELALRLVGYFAATGFGIYFCVWDSRFDIQLLQITAATGK